MKIAHYVGDHAKDDLGVRLGWAITRLAQKGPFKNVTHCEAIHDEWSDGSVTIASSSLRDGGVRIKPRVRLDPDHWLITEVPVWDIGRSRSWFALHNGKPYDLRGALATLLPGKEGGERYFCNESVAASVGLLTPANFTPAQFAAICMSFGANITSAFFAERPRSQK